MVISHRATSKLLLGFSSFIVLLSGVLLGSTLPACHLTAQQKAAVAQGAIALGRGACVLVRAKTDDPYAEAACVAEEELGPLLPTLFQARAKKAAMLLDAGADAAAAVNLDKEDAR